MTTATKTPPLTAALRVHVRPPWEAYDYEFVRDRLADPRLAAAGIAIQVHRAPLLAVPVGGRRRRSPSRRGGYVITEQQLVALAVHDVLAALGREDFPDLRIRHARESPGPCWVVEWGEPAPVGSAEARARFYGYSDHAIAAGRFSLPPPPAAPAAAPPPDPLSGSPGAVVPPPRRGEPGGPRPCADEDRPCSPLIPSGAPPRADAVPCPALARIDPHGHFPRRSRSGATFPGALRTEHAALTSTRQQLHLLPENGACCTPGAPAVAATPRPAAAGSTSFVSNSERGIDEADVGDGPCVDARPAGRPRPPGTGGRGARR